MTGAIGIEAGTCGSEAGTTVKGRETSDVESGASGAPSVDDEATGSVVRFNEGTSTGEAECEREGV
jgi:hypothetical protein